MTLDQAPDGVRLGATATVAITTGSAEGATLVTSSAVTTLGHPPHGHACCAAASRRWCPVEVGLVGDNGTQILSGLAAGDTVVLPSVASASTGGGFPGVGGVGGGLGR